MSSRMAHAHPCVPCFPFLSSLKEPWITPISNITMKLDNIGLSFSPGCLWAALMVSLLSVWVLVGLFFYLNRYTRREYFTIWTAAWLFYALWLTLGLRMGKVEARKPDFHDQAVLRLHFRRLPLVGQPALSRPSRPSDFLRDVHAVPGGLDLRQSQGKRQSAAIPVAHLHHARRAAACSPAPASSGCAGRSPLLGPGCCPWAFFSGAFTWPLTP